MNPYREKTANGRIVVESNTIFIILKEPIDGYILTDTGHDDDGITLIALSRNSEVIAEKFFEGYKDLDDFKISLITEEFWNKRLRSAL